MRLLIVKIRYRMAIACGPLLSFFSLSLLIRITRCACLFLAPFFKVKHLQKVVGLEHFFPLVLKYKRCLGRFERYVFRHRKSLPIREMLLIKNQRFLDACLEQKRGILLISVHHYYCFLFLHWINSFSFNPYLIRKFFPENQPIMQSFVQRKHREIFQGRLIDSSKTMRKPIQILKQGGMVILLQDSLKANASPISFLGYSMQNPIGSARLAEMTDSLILPLLTTNQIRNQKRWAIDFWPPIDPREGNTKEKTISSLEKMILTYPEAWDRWDILDSRDRFASL